MVSSILIGYFLWMLSDQQGGLDRAFAKVFEAFSSASFGWLAPAIMLHLVGFALISLRWKFMLRAQDIQARFSQLFLYYFMAAFFNTFLPSTIVSVLTESVAVVGLNHLGYTPIFYSFFCLFGFLPHSKSTRVRLWLKIFYY